jgi:hypothetical protein
MWRVWQPTFGWREAPRRDRDWRPACKQAALVGLQFGRMSAGGREAKFPKVRFSSSSP